MLRRMACPFVQNLSHLLQSANISLFSKVTSKNVSLHTKLWPKEDTGIMGWHFIEKVLDTYNMAYSVARQSFIINIKFNFCAESFLHSCEVFSHCSSLTNNSNIKSVVSWPQKHYTTKFLKILDLVSTTVNCLHCIQWKRLTCSIRVQPLRGNQRLRHAWNK